MKTYLTLLALTLFICSARIGHSQEQERIQKHLQKAEAFLGQNDKTRTISLTPTQQAAREQSRQRLRLYRERGIFPVNHHDLGALPTPVFRDKDGTLCAMGYLIWESGRHDIVEKIATTRDFSYIHELASDAELGEWLKDNGLTLEEAARIQPTYCFKNFDNYQNNNCYPTHFTDGGNFGGDGLVAILVAVSSIDSIIVNHLIHDRYTRNFRGNLGIGSGFLTEIGGLALLAGGTKQVGNRRQDAMLGGLLVFGIGRHAHKMGIHAFHEGRKRKKQAGSLTVSPTLQNAQGKKSLGVVASYSLSL
jgi:hypothetical protein